MKISTFNSFKNRNFRLFFAGQSLSLIGTWMQKTAVSWVIYSITQSKFMLGVSVFATLFPTAVFSIFGGITADRHSRYRILLITQVLSLIQAILMTLAIIFFKQNAVVLIIALSVLLGIINSFDVPARQSLVREMIEDPLDLPNALALNSSMVNLSKLIGPALAGFILEHFGDQISFGLNALSFIPVIISLLYMKLPKYVKKERPKTSITTELKQAFVYLKSNTTINSVIIFTGLMSFFVLPFTTLTPVYAKDIFNGSASTLGILDGIIGFGAFLGAIYLASLKKETNLNLILVRNSLVFGLGLMLFSYMTSFNFAMLFIAIASFGMMAIRTLTNTIIQVNVPNEFRGRVISIYLMVLTSMMPLGSLLVGGISHYIGVQLTVLIQGVIAIIIAFLYYNYLKSKKQIKV
ncbi:MFS transporter [Flavobacterium agrisoli]|uniref:MFS transporter n=1 Tax=Flavobacterium agrisoli TaxID=2793066 RepID=A0A934PMA0_9FLAO|nr:MFS transporter [Flavobacterium agrisoli]MBK0370147.1 MFS transporter [Flavobacterium agrisoli]